MPWTEFEDPERECKADEPAVDAKAEIELRWAMLRAAKRAKIASGAGGTSADDTLRGDELDRVLGHETGGIAGWEHTKRPETRREEVEVTTKVETNGKTKVEAAENCPDCGTPMTKCGRGGVARRCYVCRPGNWAKPGMSKVRKPKPEANGHHEPAIAAELPVPPAVDHEPEIEPEPPVRRFTLPEFVEVERSIDDQVVKLARALRELPPDVRRAVLAFAVAYEEEL
jgi:hypothetical protein